ncbi:hypothetical protein O181_042112 [Austropuccinia psidii MF-1]|uniref:Uncharacterized protein n=1 Tax=Austropuccinia psidii MF-1 TaxID=1389203 RepID=A0A9Q3DM52_9BASI|nr:hypothetical protein [Austropuccinia psidii MF-1]
MAPLATTRALGPTLYIKGFWAIIHGPQSVCRGPWSGEQLRPFWPNSNEAKGGSSAVSNHKWAHLSHFLTQNPINPKWPKNHLRTQIGHKSVHGLWKPSEATRSAPSKDSPQAQGMTSPSSMHSILKDQEWCIYGIIYNYAPFLIRNPMVTLSDPNE